MGSQVAGWCEPYMKKKRKNKQKTKNKNKNKNKNTYTLQSFACGVGARWFKEWGEAGGMYAPRKNRFSVEKNEMLLSSKN